MTESASVITVQRDRAGNAWISIDSLVDLLADMADPMADGPTKRTLMTLANTFRPMSTYAEMDAALADDGSTMVGRRCSTCQAVVIDGTNISRTPLVVDAEPDANGELFPLRITNGVPMLAPWKPGLDGIGTVRLTEHSCRSKP